MLHHIINLKCYRMNVVSKFTIKAKVKVTAENIDDLLVSAFEGGINYWCHEVKVISMPPGIKETLASYAISKGGVLQIFDRDSYDTWELTLPKFIKGLKKYMKANGVLSMEGIIDNHDASTADAIVQLALFGEIVFG